MKILLSLIFILLSVATKAEKVALPDEILKKIHDDTALNAKRLDSYPASEVERPWAEFEEVKTVLFSSDFMNGAQYIKRKIVANLPKGVKVIVYGDKVSNELAIQHLSESLSTENKIESLEINTGHTFWARDLLPIPVVLKDSTLGLTDANYLRQSRDRRSYKSVNPDHHFANHFKVPLNIHRSDYEGGNYTNDGKGNCFYIGYGTAKNLSHQVLKDFYGCKQVRRITYPGKGIGHIDERMMFLSPNQAVTDDRNIQATLVSLGYNVTMLPISSHNYGSYINALLVNGTIFMPTFDDEKTDQKAQEVYKSLGFKVVPIQASKLFDQQGGIHCITMTYPKSSINLQSIDGGWSDWIDQTKCDQLSTEFKKQIRYCNSPFPSVDGKSCVGESTREVRCIPIDGGWSKWFQESDQCSRVCGGGEAKASRSCNSPSPEFGGKNCEGNSSGVVICNKRKCHPIDGGWSSWRKIRGCNASCGEGRELWVRSCNSPRPKDHGKKCEGPDREYRKCNLRPCAGNLSTVQKENIHNGFEIKLYEQRSSRVKIVGEVIIKNPYNTFLQCSVEIIGSTKNSKIKQKKFFGLKIGKKTSSSQTFEVKAGYIKDFEMRKNLIDVILKDCEFKDHDQH